MYSVAPRYYHFGAYFHSFPGPPIIRETLASLLLILVIFRPSCQAQGNERHNSSVTSSILLLLERPLSAVATSAVSNYPAANGTQSQAPPTAAAILNDGTDQSAAGISCVASQTFFVASDRAICKMVARSATFPLSSMTSTLNLIEFFCRKLIQWNKFKFSERWGHPIKSNDRTPTQKKTDNVTRQLGLVNLKQFLPCENVDLFDDGTERLTSRADGFQLRVPVNQNATFYNIFFFCFVIGFTPKRRNVTPHPLHHPVKNHVMPLAAAIETWILCGWGGDRAAQ